MSTLNIADKQTMDTVNTDVTYVKNNLPSGSTSPVLVIKNTDNEYTGVEFTVTCKDFTDTITMPDASNVEVAVPYVGEYTVSCDDSDWTVQVLGNGKTVTKPMIKIVSFSTGTDKQIKKMLDAYYADELTWQDMCWSIGDTRTISLAQMDKPSPNSGTFAATNITVVIVDHDNTNLVTPINGHTKSCITVQFRECIGSQGSRDGTDGTIYINGSSSRLSASMKWSNLYMRTYLNSTVWDAMSSTFKEAIKTSSHYRHTNYKTSESELVTDNLFLPSVPELISENVSSSYYVATSPTEGNIFTYYNTSSNRIKYGNNNGSPNNNLANWWIGSPYASTDSAEYEWNIIHNYGTSSPGGFYHYSGLIPAGLAPAFAM